MKHELLFEIGTEEIPAKFMPGILDQLQTTVASRLQELRIPCEDVRVFGTPRRIVFLAAGVSDTQESTTVESKGPAVRIAFDEKGEPSKAAQGFARGQGVNVAELEVRGEYVYAVKKMVGQPVQALMPDFLLDVITSLSFPKNMRWADHDFRFVRPIRWLTALFDAQVIPVEITGVKSGRTTFGHRFLSSGEVEVPEAAQYENILRQHFVLVDQNERRALIRSQVEELARKEGGTAEIDRDLLEEVVYLVEYPTALCGHFDEKFLRLPKEAIITPMREHQRYFPVLNEQGGLLAKFITVRNGGSEGLDIVTQGNERVLRARLSDAEFFFNEDRKHRLADRLEKLKTVVFQEGLGNIYDKSLRVSAVAMVLKSALNADVDEEHLKRAGLLAKTDLVTGMVCEFTELQGVMGREYALLDGENSEVAEAIYEHYLPRFAGDELPKSTIGRLVAIADKLDNIAATFSRGLVPTGSQDPYALRRQAIGIVNILLDGSYHLPLQKVLLEVLQALKLPTEKINLLLPQLREFFLQRVKNTMSEQGIRYDVIEAVTAEEANDDIVDLFARAKALASYVETPAAAVSIQAFTRVANLSKKACDAGIIRESLFKEPAERELYAVVSRLQKETLPALISYDYPTVLSLVDAIAAPVNNFFDTVMVMDKDEDVKNNRLALLVQVKETAGMVGDLSIIVL
ncbi:MAG: glycine--tRNA ligase subunit beta [Acidaminococcaceae bacterium]|nr:glycine--tRNA ligase subunit beta [Acidaminococcaceae bacterium]